MITIMKASAGSGKTFNLAKTYIRLLLESKEAFAYRHILAVTFTNKATDEMKKRILDELHILAVDPLKSGYYKDFVPSHFPTAEALKAKSHTMLTQILHDYSAFSVSTIDRFFQLAIKAFAREIGQFSTYQIELDKESLIREAADRLLDNIQIQDKQVLEWMEDSMNMSFTEGKGFDFNNKLYDIAKLAKSEELERELELHGLSAETAFSAERLSKTSAVCEKVISDWENQVNSIKIKVREILKSAGLSEEDFSRKWIKYVSADDFKAPSDPVRSICISPELWFRKADTGKNMALLAGMGLENALREYMALFEGDSYSIYCTAVAIKDTAHDLALAYDIRRQFDELLKEKNVLSIDDTNTILRDIISDSDTPFIYEKLGVRFENFLLDEFQDTSAVQWDNFKPLLAESNASQYENLIVGDVKQSIYRWRGSDWALLAAKVKEEFPDSVEKSLDENWRSCRNIVEFNNAFYRFAAKKINDKFGSGLDIYSDVKQQVRLNDSQDGFVKVNFTEERDEIFILVKESIQEALNAQAKPSDIAILVRRNSVGAEIARYLINEGFQVVSNDSMMDEASTTVRKLMSLLSAKSNPEDSLNSYLSSSLGIDLKTSHHNLLDSCEYFLRELYNLEPDVFNGDIPYIESFMDELRNWTSKYGNDLTGFVKHWKEDNDKFKLSSPEDEDAITIITSHKSKGLEYPYVIMPFANDNGRGKSTNSETHWRYLDLSNGALKDVPENIYPLKFGSSLKNTAAKAMVEKEEYMSWIDYLNTFYVSTTRACKGLHIIAEKTSNKDFKYISDYLHIWLGTDEWSNGAMYDFSKMKRKSETSNPFKTEYPSFPLNPDSENPRLEVSREAGDFFGEAGTVGVAASPRRRGIVMHDILSRVRSGEDISNLVKMAAADGQISASEEGEVLSLLNSRLISARERGWFSPYANVRNEVEILDTDGSLKRPDRVEILPDGSVVIIDFKFGEYRTSYHKQVSLYMDLYHRMGHQSVKGYIWFVDTDEVQEII